VSTVDDFTLITTKPYIPNVSSDLLLQQEQRADGPKHEIRSSDLYFSKDEMTTIIQRNSKSEVEQEVYGYII